MPENDMMIMDEGLLNVPLKYVFHNDFDDDDDSDYVYDDDDDDDEPIDEAAAVATVLRPSPAIIVHHFTS